MPAEKIPGWIERLLMPKLSEISGDIKAINARIDSTNEKIDSLRNETKTEITSLRTEITSLRNETKMEISSLRTEMTVRLDSIEKRIPVIEEIAALRIKIAEIEKRVATA
jgi:chromosome segregation ATPase